jgi:hypothetical protein
VPPIDASLIRGIQDRSERFRVATEGSALRCLHDGAGGGAFSRCGGDPDSDKASYSLRGQRRVLAL